MMGLELFIKKPVLSLTLCLLIVLLGGAAYFALPVREYPLLPSYEITITTNYPGANPKEMEGFITIPMQQALSGLEGLDYMSSTNIENQSVITLKFFLGVDIDAILPQVNARIASIRWKLPPNINSPQIVRVDPNQAASGAILYIAASSEKLNSEQMTEYLTRNVVPRFEAVKGVATVSLFGNRDYAMRIWLNPAKMAARHVSASDVKLALLSYNMLSTSGTLNSASMRLNVTASSTLATAAEFNNIVIKRVGDNYVKLGDIGQAQLGSTDYLTNAYANGKPCVMMGVMNTNESNSIQTAVLVKQALNKMQKDLPPAIAVKTVWDVTQFARASIREVYLTILEASIAVFFVVFIFLGSLRTITVPLITIPLSILGAAALMYILNYSLNTLTLLAWVISIGLVVDDSIVVVENIHRHMELGETRFKSALLGVHELRFAIITMTLSVAVVFMPIGFVPGVPGALFSQFAFTMSLVVIISGVLALYVSPMLCTKLIPKMHSEQSLTAKVDRIFERIRIVYRKILKTVVTMRWLVLIVYVLLIVAGLHIIDETPGELAPTENEGIIIGMGIGPSDANLDYMNRYSVAMNKVYESLPEMQDFGLFNAIPLFGSNVANSWVVLTPPDTRKRTEDQVMAEVAAKFKRIPGLMVFAVKMPPIPGALPGQPVNFLLKANAEYDQLNTQMEKLIKYADKYPGLQDPNTTFKVDKVSVDVDINRNKAAQVGVPVGEIVETLSVMLGEPIINRFSTMGYSYEVIPQVYRRFRFNPDNINNMYVKNLDNEMIQLSNLITVTRSVAPQSLDEFQQLHSATLQAGIAPGYTLGQVLTFLETVVDKHMPPAFGYDFIGQARQYVQSQGTLLISFGFALCLIYLLLSAHFNSFRDPLIVILSVPLALTGALFVMYLTGSTLNIYTKIGLLMLVGLISKHGILIVDFANSAQERGMSKTEAALEAATIRLRPILMTTSAMIFGALPLALASGAGSIARQQIGWVIIGGMALGTCLTLFVVPTVYAIFAKKIANIPNSV